MNISIKRLRDLASRKVAAGDSMRESWQRVRFAQDELRVAETAKLMHLDEHGKKHAEETMKPFDTAIASATERLRRCEEEHARLHEEFEAVSRLARRGYEFARQHTTIPADVAEALL